MKIVVALRQTVDLVEELEVSDDGTDLEREYLAFQCNEWDEQALEEALLLADEAGAEVSVIALDEPDVDQSLYAALAKGAARATKLVGAPQGALSNLARAAILAEHLRGIEFDLLLTGVQSPEDLDGQVGGLLAGLLGLPHVAVAVGVQPHDGAFTISQEIGAGVIHELRVSAPAVIGVQNARRPPRYVPISRIRATMQEGAIEQLPAPGASAQVSAQASVRVRRLYAPQSSSRAEMLSGGSDEIAARIVEIITERGAVKLRPHGGAP
ncbi:MAG: electron transfer flavoprotein subunit beta/FixA family protein [Solirubrobacteraceae bacterium]